MKIYIGGWKEVSLVDVLEHSSFTVWLSYCNFRCPWCSNSRLARGEVKEAIEVDYIAGLVVDAKDFVDYFHVTGGEPLLQYNALKELFHKVSEKTGLPLSLDTNASMPSLLEEMFRFVEIDHIAIDVKAPLNDPNKYALATGMSPKVMHRVLELVRKGIILADKHATFLELRSTMAPGILGVSDVARIAESISALDLRGGNRKVYVVQQFIPYEGVPESYRHVKQTPKKAVIEAAKRASEILGDRFEVWYRTIDEGAVRIA